MSDLRERTFFPPEESGVRREFEQLVEFMQTVPVAVLRSPEGEETLIPPGAYEVLRDVVDVLRRGQAITVASQETVLTTQEAADLLGMSRPTFVKILERGEIKYTRPGRHRRVRLVDVLEYQKRLHAATRRGLDELVAVSEDANLYDEAFDRAPRRR